MGLSSGWGIEIVPDGGSSTIIGAITEQNIDTGTEVQAPITAGAQAPTYGEVTTVQPGGTFTSASIIALKNLLGKDGACLAGGASPGFALYHLEREKCGSLKSGSVHRRSVIPNGRVVPRVLSVQHGQRATMSAEVFSYWDGTNEPLIKESTVAAPTGLTDQVGFHLGTVNVGGVALTRKTSLEVNFGVTVQTENDGGDLTARSLQMESTSPVITITTRDVSKFASIANAGLHGTHANSDFVLRQRLRGTGSYMTGTNSAKGTFDGIITVQSIGSSANAPTAMQISIQTLDDGTNDQIVWDDAFDPDA